MSSGILYILFYLCVFKLMMLCLCVFCNLNATCVYFEFTFTGSVTVLKILEVVCLNSVRFLFEVMIMCDFFKVIGLLSSLCMFECVLSLRIASVIA